MSLQELFETIEKGGSGSGNFGHGGRPGKRGGSSPKGSGSGGSAGSLEERAAKLGIRTMFLNKKAPEKDLARIEASKKLAPVEAATIKDMPRGVLERELKDAKTEAKKYPDVFQKYIDAYSTELEFRDAAGKNY